MTAPPLSPAEQAVVDRFENAPDPYAEGESVQSVFWRLVKQGMPSGEIGNHPDYRAAIELEQAAHSDDCPSRVHILRYCCCGVGV